MLLFGRSVLVAVWLLVWRIDCLVLVWLVLCVINSVEHEYCIYYVCLCLLLWFVCDCCFDLRFVLLRG